MRQHQETVKRYLVFLFGLAVMALAVSVMSKAALGISPVQSICYVIYRRFSEHVSLGGLIFCWNCVLILFQLVLIRKQFGIKQLLQIPTSFFLSFMVDLISGLLAWLNPTGLAAKTVTMVCGVIILAFSISVTVAAGAIVNPGEGAVVALADTVKQPFGRLKVIFDITLISLGVILSFILFGEWRFDVIGLGTVIAATTTGLIVGLMNRFVKPAVTFICTGRKE